MCDRLPTKPEQGCWKLIDVSQCFQNPQLQSSCIMWNLTCTWNPGNPLYESANCRKRGVSYISTVQLESWLYPLIWLCDLLASRSICRSSLLRCLIVCALIATWSSWPSAFLSGRVNSPIACNWQRWKRRTLRGRGREIQLGSEWKCLEDGAASCHHKPPTGEWTCLLSSLFVW